MKPVRDRVKRFTAGLGFYPKAAKIIFKYHLWPLLILPGLFTLFYIPGIVLACIFFFDNVYHLVYGILPEFMQWKILAFLLTVAIWIVNVVVGFLAYRFLILTLFEHLLAYLSEFTEQIILGNTGPAWSMEGFVSDFKRGFQMNIRGLIKTIIVLLLSWCIAFIPVVGPIISTALALFAQCFFSGCSLVDFTLERKKYSIAETGAFARKYRPSIFGIGAGFNMLLLIPLVGWFLAPGCGAISGTLFALEQLDREKELSAEPQAEPIDQPAETPEMT
jgi:CysZ protein